MQMQSEGKPVEEIVAAIQALDLEPIKFKLMDTEEGQGWSREYVEQMAIAYKRFLTLSVKYPEETIAPSKDVDKFWHGHILDTMKYAEDCQNVFGYFVHHFPYFGMRGEEDAANLAEAGRTTKRLYEQEFGETIPSRASMCGVAVTRDQAAMCGVAVANDAAMCGAAVSMCGVAVTKDAAMCGVAVTRDQAAMCGVAVANDAAMCGAAVSMCGVAVTKDAAMCGVAVANDAAMCGAAVSMCGVAVTKDAAMCGVAAARDQAAMCGVAVGNDAAMCGAAVSMCGVAVTNAAMCGATKKEGSVTALFGAGKPTYRDKLNTSVRPRLALAA